MKRLLTAFVLVLSTTTFASIDTANAAPKAMSQKEMSNVSAGIGFGRVLSPAEVQKLNAYIAALRAKYRRQ